MKKPHEQQLSAAQFDRERRCIVETDADGIRMVAVLRNFDAAPWECFFLGAHDMARALLAWVRAGESGNPSMIPDLDEQARAALRKAGVLP